jgi:hypothetical protein
MTIDERLEALTQSVELIASAQADAERRTRQGFETLTSTQADSERRTRQGFETLTSLHADTDARINKLIDLAETQQRQIEAHDAQIDALLTLAEKHAESQANLERQWQAYINTLPRA